MLQGPQHSTGLQVQLCGDRLIRFGRMLSAQIKERVVTWTI